MKIGEIIDQGHVVVGLRVADKGQLLRELARRAGAELGLNDAIVLAALQAREALGSTGLGRGFALPHARLRGLPRHFALFVRLARPIEFSAIDERPVDLVILLLTPADADTEHLALLATLARPMRNTGFVQRLREAADADRLYEQLVAVVDQS